VIPARFTATNLTRNFPATVTEGFSQGTFANVVVEVGYSAGARCIDGNYSSQVKVGSNAELPPGRSVQVPLFFIVKGFFTPAHPTGDPAVLRRAKVIFGSQYELTATRPGLIEAGTSQRIVPIGG
jgi:hypothetical protein